MSAKNIYSYKIVPIGSWSKSGKIGCWGGVESERSDRETREPMCGLLDTLINILLRLNRDL